jgi:isopenicillin-N N-acyltransferase-like protein
MKRSISLILILSLIFSSCRNETGKNQSPVIQENVKSTVQLLADGKLRYLELSGTPYERGLMHGGLLKEEIHEVIRLFKEDIKQNTNEEPDQFIAQFLEQTDYKSSILKWTPDLMEELKGISEGARIDFETILMHQLGDEYWFNTKDILAHNCSSFGVNKSSEQSSIAAQNMDIPPFYNGFQTVIKIIDPDADKEMMFLTIPGHLGITGMNNKSVSINCNTLMQLDYGKTGLPVTFIVRGVVEKNTQEEALKFLSEIKHASGQNYIIGGSEKVYSMECSSNKIAEFRPFEGSNFTYHTNHPMSNRDYSKNYLDLLKKENRSLEEGLYECQRIKSFQKRFNTETGNITIEEIKDVLQSRDNETKDVVSNDYTYASVIYVLSEKAKFIIAPGKPHEQDYIEIDFE